MKSYVTEEKIKGTQISHTLVSGFLASGCRMRRYRYTQSCTVVLVLDVLQFIEGNIILFIPSLRAKVLLWSI